MLTFLYSKRCNVVALANEKTDHVASECWTFRMRTIFCLKITWSKTVRIANLNVSWNTGTQLQHSVLPWQHHGNRLCCLDNTMTTACTNFSGALVGAKMRRHLLLPLVALLAVLLAGSLHKTQAQERKYYMLLFISKTDTTTPPSPFRWPKTSSPCQ